MYGRVLNDTCHQTEKYFVSKELNLKKYKITGRHCKIMLTTVVNSIIIIYFEIVFCLIIIDIRWLLQMPAIIMLNQLFFYCRKKILCKSTWKQQY